MTRISRAAVSLLFLMTAACSAAYQRPSKSPINFDSAYLNRQIKLLVVEQWPYKTNDSMAVLLEYKTTNVIVFPSNYNLRIFIEQGGEWVVIQEKPFPCPEDPIVLSPDTVTNNQIVAFWPQLDDLNKTYFMRLYVFGEMTTPEGIKAVAAFVDFVVTQ
jgi:hypothetical protein